MKFTRGFTIQDYDLRNAFGTERKLLLLSGFYPRREKSIGIMYIIGAIFTLSISYAQLFSMIAVLAGKDLSELSEAMPFFITHLTFLCKLANFCFYRAKLLQIEDQLANPLFYGFSFDQLKLIKDRIRTCVFIGHLFRLTCVFGTSFWGLTPFLDVNKKNQLPLPGRLPYDVTKYYAPSYGFQVLSIAVSAYNNSSMDIMTWLLITVAAAQFEILNEHLKNIEYRFGPHRQGRDSETAKAELKECVKHHRKIKELVVSIEAMFSNGIFLQFFSSVIVICMTGFQMIVVVPFMSISFLTLVTYFACMLCQVAMYCWYGHDLMTTSNETSKFLYMSNWYESDAKVRKMMTIFMEAARKPVILTAGKFVTLSLMTLTSILRSSYSFFAVLQRLYTDK